MQGGGGGPTFARVSLQAASHRKLDKIIADADHVNRIESHAQHIKQALKHLLGSVRSPEMRYVLKMSGNW